MSPTGFAGQRPAPIKPGTAALRRVCRRGNRGPLNRRKQAPADTVRGFVFVRPLPLSRLFQYLWQQSIRARIPSWRFRSSLFGDNTTPVPRGCPTQGPVRMRWGSLAASSSLFPRLHTARNTVSRSRHSLMRRLVSDSRDSRWRRAWFHLGKSARWVNSPPSSDPMPSVDRRLMMRWQQTPVHSRGLQSVLELNIT